MSGLTSSERPRPQKPWRTQACLSVNPPTCIYFDTPPCFVLKRPYVPQKSFLVVFVYIIFTISVISSISFTPFMEIPKLLFITSPTPPVCLSNALAAVNECATPLNERPKCKYLRSNGSFRHLEASKVAFHGVRSMAPPDGSKLDVARAVAGKSGRITMKPATSHPLMLHKTCSDWQVVTTTPRGLRRLPMAPRRMYTLLRRSYVAAKDIGTL